MSKSWDVVVIGGANWDYLVRGPALPKQSETVPGDEFVEDAGGKGANQAIAAARLGARVAFVGRVVSDWRGDRILQKLNAGHVHADCVSRDPAFATGVALVMVDRQGEKQIQTAPGANRRVTAADVDRAASLIADARVVLTQLEIPVPAVQRALELASQSGAEVVLDPAPPVPLADDLLELVHVIRANAGEAEVLTGVRVEDRASARRAAEVLLSRGPQAAVIQAGSQGNLAVTRQDEQWLPTIPVTSVDSTGAGDAFAGALAAKLAHEEPLMQAVAFAHAASAFKTTRLGAQAGLPTRAEVLAILSTHQTA